MKTLIHEITTQLKFLYPCSTHCEDPSGGKELTIVAETNLTDLYPTQKYVEGMENVGNDFWGHTHFKDAKGIYFCDVDGVLHYKGPNPEGDPQYSVDREIDYVVPDIDENFERIGPCIDKAREFFGRRQDLELIDTKTTLQGDLKNPYSAKIVVIYKLELR